MKNDGDYSVHMSDLDLLVALPKIEEVHIDSHGPSLACIQSGQNDETHLLLVLFVALFIVERKAMTQVSHMYHESIYKHDL